MTGHRVLLGGRLREHLAAAVEQLSASTPYTVPLVVQDVRHDPAEARLFEDYRGDLSGRYLRAVADAVEQDLPVDEAKAAEVLAEVLACQTPDGTFGPARPRTHLDHGAAWGHGLLLAGLLAAQAWAPDKLADGLARATERLVQATVARAPAWAAALTASTGLQKFGLDPLAAVLPLVRHAELTGSEQSLEAAWTLTEALPADRHGAHMHGYLLAQRGRLELALLTGDEAGLDAVRADAAAVARDFRLPHGGVLESLSTPWDANTEGCGIADWVMLNLRLYALDGSGPALAEAMLATYNALLHCQQLSGHFGCETLSGESGLLLTDYAPEAWWCCTFHGIHALNTLSDYAIDAHGNEVSVHLPMPATMLDDIGRTVLTVSGDYPYADEVVLEAGEAFPAGGTLRVRIPETAAVCAVERGGRPVDADASDGWVRVHDAGPGTAVRLRLRQHQWFDLDGVTGVPPFGNSTVRPPDLSCTRCALFRGPLLLAANAADNPVEDLLGGRRLVLPAAGLPPYDGTVAVTARGYDSFRRTLRLAPLAGRERTRHARVTRIWYQGLLTTDTGVH